MREKVEASRGYFFNNRAIREFKVFVSGYYALTPRFSNTASKLFFAWLLNRPLRNTSLITLTGSSAAR